VNTPQKKMNRPLRALLIILGTLSVVLGILGMLLPVLPTTPFLLLAATCYARSSEKFYDWLTTNRWFGAYIKNYREGRGIPRKQKALTLLFLWLTIGLTVCLGISQWWLRTILIATALSVTIYLLKVKTYKPESTP
jgi:uncharacterized membrane protein YbaN (DUF454 family)